HPRATPPRLPLPLSLHDALRIFRHYRVDGAQLGAVLAARRQGMGLSMQELANRASVSPTTVMMLEHGEINVQFDKFLQILDQLRSEEHTSELQSRENLVCRLLLE